MTARITNILLKASAVFLIFLSFHSPARGQAPLPDSVKLERITALSQGWEDWEKCSLTGKLKMAGLPLTPSVRIFMIKDSLVRISLRAPFIGEAGRAEITGSTLTVANKMNKTWCEVSLDSIAGNQPWNIVDFQNIILGRATLPGLGTLSPQTACYMEVYEDDDASATMIPIDEGILEGINYGFVVSPENRLSALVAVPWEKPDTNLQLEYWWNDGGYDIEALFTSPQKNLRAILELDYPDWEGTGFEASPVNPKFRKVDFPNFLKAF